MLALAQATATPLPAGVEDDVRCAATLQSAIITEASDEHSALAAGLLYYVGRIEGAAPAIDAKAAVEREQVRPDHDKRYRENMVRCLERLTQRMMAFDPKVAG